MQIAGFSPSFAAAETAARASHETENDLGEGATRGKTIGRTEIAGRHSLLPRPANGGAPLREQKPAAAAARAVRTSTWQWKRCIANQSGGDECEKSRCFACWSTS